MGGGELSFFKIYSCAKFDVVVVKKRLLGHSKKLQKTPKNSKNFKNPLSPFVQIHQNSIQSVNLRGNLWWGFWSVPVISS